MKICRQDALRYQWGENCDGWLLVQREGLRVTEGQMPPGGGEESHCHQHAREYFYMLSGQTVVEFDNYSVSLSPGEGLEVAPGVFHRMTNPNPLPAVFLAVSAPAADGDRVTQ